MAFLGLHHCLLPAWTRAHPSLCLSQRRTQTERNGRGTERVGRGTVRSGWLGTYSVPLVLTHTGPDVGVKGRPVCRGSVQQVVWTLAAPVAAHPAAEPSQWWVRPTPASSAPHLACQQEGEMLHGLDALDLPEGQRQESAQVEGRDEHISWVWLAVEDVSTAPATSSRDDTLVRRSFLSMRPNHQSDVNLV